MKWKQTSGDCKRKLKSKDHTGQWEKQSNNLIQFSEHVMNKINSENTPFKTTRGSQWFIKLPLAGLTNRIKPNTKFSKSSPVRDQHGCCVLNLFMFVQDISCLQMFLKLGMDFFKFACNISRGQLCSSALVSIFIFSKFVFH